VSRNHLITFCKPLIHCTCFKIVFRDSSLFRNSCLYFVCYGWSAQALTALATIYVTWWNCCANSKTAVFHMEAFRDLIMSQQGKRKTKFCWTSIHIRGAKLVSCTGRNLTSVRPFVTPWTLLEIPNFGACTWVNILSVITQDSWPQVRIRT